MCPKPSQILPERFRCSFSPMTPDHPSTWGIHHCVWNFPLTWHLRRGRRRQASCFRKQGQNREKGRKTQTDVRKRHRESLSERLASDSSREVALGWKLESIFCSFIANERVWAQQWCGVARGLQRHQNGSQDGKISRESDLAYTCAQQEPEEVNKKAGWIHRTILSLDRFIDKVIDENLFYDIQLKRVPFWKDTVLYPVALLQPIFQKGA